ncbi:LysR family transcriptional regulator [Couchioplanes caeruleus]|uniref:LysR family transcriptional regulator n=2 Tax=Couchioplanes caeruleus TaxID=56438 RepID=A0A1K0FB96_9ACTN|nr:LysR substrate-binding domain-containing protein [Couchioplanes caeruleus]OJF10125.1 LysR family transcriptional regulator [Couchioplanes caeruleus subsp. caeruleus]ROP33892.1 DNA-binding transcriptional LysR family regulator [Couchioplanes caeruleus]
MTPARLQTFLAIVEHGSARAAAQRLSVTESAVSAALAALHREAGVVLFERHGRGLRLTESGRIFAGYARRILGLLDEGLSAARQSGDPERGRVRLGAVTTAGEYLVPGLLASFRARYPQVEVTLDVGVRDRMSALLADHRLDIVIGGRPSRGSSTRATRPNSLIVVAAPGTVPELSAVTWLLREPGSGTRDTALALLDALQVAPPTLALGSHGAVVASAALGLGVTLVSADAVTGHLRQGTLQRVPVRGTPLHRPWHAVTTAAPTATATLFLEHITDRDSVGELAFRPRRGPARD